MKNRCSRLWQIFYLYFLFFHNTYEATFFKSEKRQIKAFQTDERGPEKQFTFFPYLIKLKKKVLSGTRNVLMSTGFFVTVLK